MPQNANAAPLAVQPTGAQAQYLMNVEGDLVTIGSGVFYSAGGYIVPGFSPPVMTLIAGRTV